MIDLNKEHEVFEKWYSKMWIGSFDKSKCGEFYKAAKVNMSWLAWIESAKAKQSEIDELKAKLAKVESGELVIVPKEPSMEMWSEIPRQLGRYMQMHDRYCPKTLKKHFDRFIGEIPEWLNK